VTQRQTFLGKSRHYFSGSISLGSCVFGREDAKKHGFPLISRAGSHFPFLESLIGVRYCSD
jgi:hypothetical protein